MSWTKEQLLERIQATEVWNNGRRRYAAELRRDVAEYAQEKVAEGQSRTRVARELGLDSWTVTRWLQGEEKTGDRNTAFVEVSSPKVTAQRVGPQVMVTTSALPFELTCPNGFSVQVPAGFQENELRRLLRAVES